MVRMSQLAKRPDGGYQARLDAVPIGATDDLDGVVDRADLQDVLRRAADRDPAFRPPAATAGDAAAVGGRRTRVP